MSFLTNPIFTHLLAAALGGALVWYPAHKAAVKAAAAAVTTAIDAVKKDAKV